MERFNDFFKVIPVESSRACFSSHVAGSPPASCQGKEMTLPFLQTEQCLVQYIGIYFHRLVKRTKTLFIKKRHKVCAKGGISSTKAGPVTYHIYCTSFQPALQQFCGYKKKRKSWALTGFLCSIISIDKTAVVSFIRTNKNITK